MRLILAFATCLVASAALAHTGVKNAAVKARMDVMEEAKQAMATLGDMARGKARFDAAQAAHAQSTLVAVAAKTPMVYEEPATDPKSEARAEIWSDWDGFVAQAKAMERAAEALDVSTLDTLRAGIGPVGKRCGACHEDYRIKK